MAPIFPSERRAGAPRAEGRDPFAAQVRLSRIHTRLVPMQATGIGYAVHPAAAGWFELPPGRGFAGYGLGRALALLLDAMRGLSALNESMTESGEPFSHGEFAPLRFRVDPLGVCRLIPLTTRHYVSEYIAPPRAALGFLSPERLIGEKVGLRADVFSAGILLWEALAGRRLVDDTQSAEAISERLMSGRIRVPPLAPQLDWATPLKAEVERALSVNQRRRFANCAEFSEVILRLAQDRVASNDEIAAFFASNFSTTPSGSPNSDRRPDSPAEVSREVAVAKRAETFRMLPFASLAPASNPNPIGELDTRRRTTLKMNVTLKMAQLPMPIRTAEPFVTSPLQSAVPEAPQCAPTSGLSPLLPDPFPALTVPTPPPLECHDSEQSRLAQSQSAATLQEPELIVATPIPTQISFLHPSSTVTSIPPTTTEPSLDEPAVGRRNWAVPTLAIAVALLMAATAALKLIATAPARPSATALPTAVQHKASASANEASVSVAASPPAAFHGTSARGAAQGHDVPTLDADLTPGPARSAAPGARAIPARPAASAALPSAKDYGI